MNMSDDRGAVKQQLKLYFKQLTTGCGNTSCDNPLCASSSSGSGPFDQKTALKRAVELAKSGALLCVSVPKALNSSLTVAVLDKIYKESGSSPAAEFTRRSFTDPLLFQSVFCVSGPYGIKSPTCDDPAIDFKELEGVFEFLASNISLENSLEKFLKGFLSPTLLKDALSKDTPLVKLRKLFVLLHSSFIFDPLNRHELANVCDVMLSILDTSRECSDAALKWFKLVPLQLSERLLGTFKTLIALEWEKCGASLEKLRDVSVQKLLDSCLQVFRIQFNANLLRSENDRIEIEEFYVEAVNESLDVMFDLGTFLRYPTKFCFSKYPFVLDVVNKAEILQIHNKIEMRDRLEQAAMDSLFGGGEISLFFVLNVNRHTLIEDSIMQIQIQDHSSLRRPLKVKFTGEEGVDEGGVRKEYFLLLLRDLFDPKYGMFLYEEESHVFWFNPSSFESYLTYELIGILVGLAIYNGVILDLKLPSVTYKLLLGQKPTLTDLQKFRPSMYRGVKTLLEFDGDVETTFMRTFSVEREFLGTVVEDELKPGGKDIPLTKDNREEYVSLYIQYVFEKSVSSQLDAFKAGFNHVCNNPFVKTFQPSELELLVCGSSELDFDDLEEGAVYTDGYEESSRAIKWFWSIVKKLTVPEKKQFLAFMSGTDRIPVGGLGDLRFTISRQGPDSENLPTAHTCFNHLLLPDYSSEEKMEKKLRVAISNYEGFGLI